MFMITTLFIGISLFVVCCGIALREWIQPKHADNQYKEY